MIEKGGAVPAAVQLRACQDGSSAFNGAAISVRAFAIALVALVLAASPLLGRRTPRKFGTRLGG